MKILWNWYFAQIKVNSSFYLLHCSYDITSYWDTKTHWGREKVDAISQTTFLNSFFMNENIWISIQISLKFVPKASINNISAMVQIMACGIHESLNLNELIHAAAVADCIVFFADCTHCRQLHDHTYRLCITYKKLWKTHHYKPSLLSANTN